MSREIKGISIYPLCGSAGPASARPSVKVCNAFAISTPASRSLQERDALGIHRGQCGKSAAQMGCAVQVAVELATVSGIAATAVKSVVSGPVRYELTAYRRFGNKTLPKCQLADYAIHISEFSLAIHPHARLSARRSSGRRGFLFLKSGEE